MRGAQNMPVLEKYMTQDRRNSQVWLVRNPDWKMIAAGARRDQWSNP
jgi:hypothetical protein